MTTDAVLCRGGPQGWCIRASVPSLSFGSLSFPLRTNKTKNSTLFASVSSRNVYLLVILHAASVHQGFSRIYGHCTEYFRQSRIKIHFHIHFNISPQTAYMSPSNPNKMILRKLEDGGNLPSKGVLIRVIRDERKRRVWLHSSGAEDSQKRYLWCKSLSPAAAPFGWNVLYRIMK